MLKLQFNFQPVMLPYKWNYMGEACWTKQKLKTIYSSLSTWGQLWDSFVPCKIIDMCQKLLSHMLHSAHSILATKEADLTLQERRDYSEVFGSSSPLLRRSTKWPVTFDRSFRSPTPPIKHIFSHLLIKLLYHPMSLNFQYSGQHTTIKTRMLQ